MSNINTVDTALESAASTEKELQLVKQQTEMKAGEALLRETSRALMEQKEKRAEKRSRGSPEIRQRSLKGTELPARAKPFLKAGLQGGVWRCREKTGKLF